MYTLVKHIFVHVKHKIFFDLDAINKLDILCSVVQGAPHYELYFDRSMGVQLN